MNSVQCELRQCLLCAQSGEDGAATLEFRYPETLAAFRGHFPGKPILPGICLLQSLRIGLEQAWGTPLRLAEIANAKFLTPIRPGEMLRFNVRESGRDAVAISVKAKITREDERVAEFSIKLQRLAKP